MTIYGYEKVVDVGSDKYPQNTHLIIEISTGGNSYIVDSADNTKIYHINASTGAITQVDIDPSNSSGDNKSRDHKIQSLWHDKTNSIVYGVDCDNDGTADDFDVWSLDYSGSETAPSVTEIGTSSGADANTVYAWDIFKIGSNVYVLNTESRTGSHVFVAWDVDASPFVEKHTWTAPAANTPTTFGAYDSGTNKIFFLYDDTGSPRVVVIEFDGTVEELAGHQVLTNYSLSSNRSLHHAAHDNSNIVYYSAIKDADSKNYILEYNITSDTLTVGAEYNVALMLDRNTDTSNDPPFNLEKGFHITSRYIYQIPATTTGKLYKIADLTNAVADGTIVAITDTFILIKRDTNDIELLKFQDFSNYILEGPEITHRERDYPTAEMKYRADKYFIEEGMFVQVIGEVNVNGSTTTDVKFEGYVIEDYLENEEAKNIRIAEMVNPSLFDFHQTLPNSALSGDTDAFIDTIDDNFNYITKGTYDDGIALDNYTPPAGNEKKKQRFLDELSISDEGTYGVNPKGVLNYVISADDSGIDYDESTPIWDVDVKVREVKVNRITIKGAYVNGVVIKSAAQDDAANQLLYGIIPKEYTFGWIQTVAKANTIAGAVKNRLTVAYTEVKFKVRDITNEFINPTQEITLAYSHKSITSAQFKINQIIHNDKTLISEYTVSSVVRWDLEDLELKLDQDQSEQIGQLAETIQTITSGIEEYFHQDASADVGGYRLLDTEVPDDSATTITATITAADQEVEQWVTASGEPNITLINSGSIDFHCHAWKSSGTKDVFFYLKLYKRTDPGGVETVLGTTHDSKLLAGSEEELEVHMVLAAGVELLATDRIVVKLFASPSGTGSNPELSFQVDGDTYTRFNLPTPQIQTSDVVSDVAYDATTWNGVSTIAPSKNAVRDKVETLSGISYGPYTGDGTDDWSNEVDCGFHARFVVIYKNEAADSAVPGIWHYIDAGNKRAQVVFDDAADCGVFDNRVRGSTNGFEVSDDGSDSDPNKNGQSYVYVAFG